MEACPQIVLGRGGRIVKRVSQDSRYRRMEGVVMDLVSAAVNLRQADVMGQVQMKVTRKLLDVEQSQGDAMVKLIESASQDVCKAEDDMVAAATGLGGNLVAAATMSSSAL